VSCFAQEKKKPKKVDPREKKAQKSGPKRKKSPKSGPYIIVLGLVIAIH
jgi:hypothetical protein